jgi:hypothetical protein
MSPKTITATTPDTAQVARALGAAYHLVLSWPCRTCGKPWPCPCDDAQRATTTTTTVEAGQK